MRRSDWRVVGTIGKFRHTFIQEATKMKNLDFRRSARYDYDTPTGYARRIARVWGLVADATAEATTRDTIDATRLPYRDAYTVAGQRLKTMGVTE